MKPLNRLGSNWNRQTRNEVNENWDIIEDNLGGSGKQSAEALTKANEALSKANKAETDSTEAKNTAESVQKQLNDIVIESGTSDAEVIIARGGYDFLNTRLTQKEYEFSMQLAHVGQEITEKAPITEIERLEREKASKAETLLKADKTYVDAIVGGITTVKPRDVFLSIAALYAAFPNGDDGFYIAYDSSFTDGAHGFIWSIIENDWKDTGLWKGDGLEDGAVTETKLAASLQNSLLKPIRNVMPNSNFSDGLTGWNPSSNLTTSVVNGVVKMLATSQTARLRGTFNREVGNIYYLFASIKSTSPLVGLHINDTMRAPHSGSGQFEFLSVIDSGSTSSRTTGPLDSRASGWDEFQVDYVGIINLTEIFGAGKEPTKAEMDQIMLTQFGGYVEVGNLFNASKTLDDITTLQTTVAEIQSTVVTEANRQILKFEQLPYYASGETGFNAVSFTQDNMTIYNGYQYVVFTNHERNPIIAKRQYPTGDWTYFDFSTMSTMRTPTNLDGHNNYVLAIDSTGYIHVAGDMHNGAITYARSTNPEDITAWTNPSMSSTTNVTYPIFLKLKDGTLLFVYREGSATSAFIKVNKYSTSTKTWSVFSTWIDGVSDSLCPYLNRIEVDVSGTIHIAGTWRDSALGGNKDIFYMKSTDGGLTFKKSNGTSITLPARVTTVETVVTIRDNSVLNQNGLMADSQGRPHITYFKKSANGYTNIYHLYHNGTAWIERQVTNFKKFVGTVTQWRIQLSRPSLFVYKDRIFIIYRANYGSKQDTLRLLEVTPSKSVIDVPILNLPLHHYEPTFDTSALLNKQELNLLVLACSEQYMFDSIDTTLDQWNKQALHILSIDLKNIDKVLNGEVRLPSLRITNTMIAPINISKAISSDGATISLREYGVLPIVNDGDKLLMARLTIRLTGDTNAKLTPRLVQLDATTSVSTPFNTLLYNTVTTQTTQQTGWRVLPSLNSGYLFAEIGVELLNSAVNTSGSITSLMIELAEIVY